MVIYSLGCICFFIKLHITLIDNFILFFALPFSFIYFYFFSNNVYVPTSPLANQMMVHPQSEEVGRVFVAHCTPNLYIIRGETCLLQTKLTVYFKYFSGIIKLGYTE